MGLIREPKDVDFFVDPRPLTDKEKQMLADYFQKTKTKENKKSAKRVQHTTVQSQLFLSGR